MHSTPRLRSFVFAFCGALAAWLLGGSTQARGAEGGRASRIVEGVVIVKFRAPIDERLRTSPRLRAALPAGLSSARGILQHRVTPAARARGLDRIVEIPLAPGSDPRKAAAQLRQLPEVEYAEPRFLVPTLEETGVSAITATPNDPRYTLGDQGYLDLIRASTAWDVIKSQVNHPLVAVVDGGTQWQHQDLQANVWTNPGEIAGNHVDDDGNGYVDDLHGWDFLAGNADPRGSSSTPENADHGTHAAGLLAAVTNNALGIASASWNPRLMAINVSASTDGFMAYGYEGILYAVDNGARIINCSWGGTDTTDFGRDVVAYAVSQGALIMAAAGNNGDQIPLYPAAFPGVYAVVNVNYLAPDTDQKRFSSCFGTWVDLSAPGSEILSTVDTAPGNAYDLMTGTSMASPIAAAVASLILAQHPTWTGIEVGEQLRVTCDNIDARNPQEWWYRLGKGRVNATRAVTETPPAVRITNATFGDSDGDGKIERGETVTVSLDLHDYHTATANLALTLNTASTDVSIVDGSEAVGAVGQGATVSRPAAFTFTVSPTATLGAQVELRVDMTATGYSDFQWLVVPIASTSSVGVEEGGGVEMGIARATLTPNPFVRGTRLQWLVSRAASYAASVYDTRGRRVRSLGERAFAAGPASLDWDGHDDRGQAVGAGIYFLRVESGGERWIKKAVVLR